MPSKIPTKSIETELLEKRLGELPQGGSIAYGELTTLIGHDVRPMAHGKGYMRLSSAIRSLRSAERKVFMLGDGGVRRLTDAEILTRQSTHIRHIHRTARRSTQELVSVDVGQLDDTGRKDFNLRMSHAVLLEEATTARAVKKIESAVQAANDKLPSAKTGLALFFNGKKEG